MFVHFFPCVGPLQMPELCQRTHRCAGVDIVPLCRCMNCGGADTDATRSRLRLIFRGVNNISCQFLQYSENDLTIDHMITGSHLVRTTSSNHLWRLKGSLLTKHINFRWRHCVTYQQFPNGFKQKFSTSSRHALVGTFSEYCKMTTKFG